MKRFFSIILVFCIIVLNFCSCSGNRNNTNNEVTVVNTVTVTFTEGKTVSQIAAILEENGVCSADEFILAVNTSDSSFVTQIKNSSERPFLLEGYVFPDTYEFYLNESAGSVLSRFLKNAERKLSFRVFFALILSTCR